MLVEIRVVGRIVGGVGQVRAVSGVVEAAVGVFVLVVSRLAIAAHSCQTSHHQDQNHRQNHPHREDQPLVFFILTRT